MRCSASGVQRGAPLLGHRFEQRHEEHVERAQPHLEPIHLVAVGLFVYLVLDKAKSNLALARRGAQDVEQTLQL